MIALPTYYVLRAGGSVSTIHEAFGKEHGATLDWETCSRCGSNARVRGLDRGKIVVLRLTCDKCHLSESRGFTSRRTFLLTRARENYRDRLESAEKVGDARTASLMRAKITRLERRLAQSELML